MNIIFLDTETSGLDGTDRIIEIGLVVMDENMKIIHESCDFCNIPFKLSDEIIKHTGIKDCDLEHAKKIKDTPAFHTLQKYNNKNSIC